jgi:hypothetical protein
MLINSRSLGRLAGALLVVGGCTGGIMGSPGSGSGGQHGSGSGGATTGGGGTLSNGSGGAHGSSSGGSAMSGSGGSGGSSNSGSGGTSSGSGTGGGPGSNPSGDCTPLAPVPRRLWRLSVEQWGAAVKDLLGLTTAPIPQNRGGEAAYAFFSDATLGVDPDFEYALYESSQTVVLPAIASTTTTLAPCSGTTAAAQRTCAMTFVQSLAAKAFRRPLDSSEVTDLMAVYDAGAMTDYPTGIGLVVQAIITAPSFLYRTELGPRTLTPDSSGNFPDTTLNPYEIAAQLGFLFLGTLPDSGLTSAAADGSIATTAGLSSQIDRLLALPATKANLTNVVIDWFNVRQMFDKANKDTSLLSSLSTSDNDQTAIVNDLYQATQQFVNDVLWTSGGTVNDLVTSQKTYLNKRLATLYPGATFSGSAPNSNTTFAAATWPSSQMRSGLLTQPSFLWSASDPVLTSIVKRGKLIHDDIVCQDALPGPVDLSTPSAMNVIACKSPDGTMSLSTCDSEVLQSDARMMYSPCKTCHSQMDPYARVLQNFGPIGNFRTADEAKRPINSSVTFADPSPLAPQSASGSVAFGQLLASTGVIKNCAVQKVASYALGNMIGTYNTCELNDLRSQVDGSIGSIFKQVAMANILRKRAGGAK